MRQRRKTLTGEEKNIIVIKKGTVTPKGSYRKSKPPLTRGSYRESYWRNPRKGSYQKWNYKVAVMPDLGKLTGERILHASISGEDGAEMVKPAHSST